MKQVIRNKINNRVRQLSKFELLLHDERFDIEEIKKAKRTDGIPECPHCGNKYMNFYLSSFEDWKCTSIFCGQLFGSTSNPAA